MSRYSPYFTTGEILSLAAFLAIVLFVILLATIRASHAQALTDNAIVNMATTEATEAYAERRTLGYSSRAARAYIRAMLHNKYALTTEVQREIINAVLRAHHKAN